MLAFETFTKQYLFGVVCVLAYLFFFCNIFVLKYNYIDKS